MKNTVRAAVTAVVAGAMLATAPAAFAQGTSDTSHAGVQSVLARAVTEGGLPGATAQIQDGDSTWFGQAGSADLATGRMFQPQDRFRIGSTTKTFIATLVLQLEAEHKLSLNDTVEHWLPGLVDGNGYDGSAITLRELLNMTSGIANYADSPLLYDEFVGPAFLTNRFDSFTPQQLVGIALAAKPSFAPGAGWEYSDTNYVLAGLIVEKATGHTLAQELAERITEPLHLKSTYEPTGDDTGIHGPHGRFYSKLMEQDPSAPFYDVTDLNPSWGFGAGDMISTDGDLITFFRALLQGRLLPPTQQREMFTMLYPGDKKWIPAADYGLGVASVKLSCGTVWGMGGAIDGSWSYTFGTRDGRHLLSTEVNGDWANGSFATPVGVFTAELESEFCAPAPTATAH
ncbi:serine hydrolase domain-containing protein [Streptacidiphilus fuscans]|uniref:Beta-lactamase family protein n=1 Tax=Streptacidiphilus fuscans TaxID=2789292 RepID=A0A931FG15_9ACTN|nr:serine hydrolase domain-containing protein [Streptacidiphilus fuscans]MBF9070850.1 beta-lactamase family protein [Streptacidiphilus fuscans]